MLIENFRIKSNLLNSLIFARKLQPQSHSIALGGSDICQRLYKILTSTDGQEVIDNGS